MVVGDKKFGVVSYVMSYFPTPRTVFCAFPETDLWIYSVRLTDRVFS